MRLITPSCHDAAQHPTMLAVWSLCSAAPKWYDQSTWPVKWSDQFGSQAWRGSINMPSTLFRYPPPPAVAPTPKASSSVSQFSFPVNFFYNFSQEKVVIRVLLPIYSVSTPCQTLKSDAVSNTDGMSNTISRQPQSLAGLGFHYLCGSKTTFFWNSFENKKQLLTQVAPNLWKLVVLLPRRL